MKKFPIGVFVLLMVFICNPVHAAQTEADAHLLIEGRAPILKNDIARAREAAVKNAQEKAVLQTAEKIISDKISDEKFQAVKSILIGKTDRYVKNYRITSETADQTDYVAVVNLMVSRSLVREDLIQMGVLQESSKPGSLSVSLNLTGIKKYSDFTRLRTFLQSRPKIVKSVYPCELKWKKAHCELVLIGDLQDLVSELEKTELYDIEAPAKNQEAVGINLQLKEGAK